MEKTNILSIFIVGIIRKFRRYIKAFVENRHTQRSILTAILVNTLSMGIEYHNQVITQIIIRLERLVKNRMACVQFSLAPIQGRLYLIIIILMGSLICFEMNTM